MGEADPRFLRIIDANYNRAKEGLRVCEDVCRFWLDDAWKSKAIKDLRHELTRAMMPLGLKKIITGRNVLGDVGRRSTRSESRRERAEDIFYANCQRVKESLRVLEEFAKLKNMKTALTIKALRYKVYVVEKGVLTSRVFAEK